MLPKLQTRYSALLLSVVVGVVWALWHLPQFFNPSALYSNLPFVLYLAFVVPFPVLLSWVFNSTGAAC